MPSKYKVWPHFIEVNQNERKKKFNIGAKDVAAKGIQQTGFGRNLHFNHCLNGKYRFVL